MKKIEEELKKERLKRGKGFVEKELHGWNYGCRIYYSAYTYDLSTRVTRVTSSFGKFYGFWINDFYGCRVCWQINALDMAQWFTQKKHKIVTDVSKWVCKDLYHFQWEGTGKPFLYYVVSDIETLVNSIKLNFAID